LRRSVAERCCGHDVLERRRFSGSSVVQDVAGWFPIDGRSTKRGENPSLSATLKMASRKPRKIRPFCTPLQPGRVAIDIGQDHEFVGARYCNERIHAGRTVSGEPLMERASMAHRLNFFRRRPVAFNVIDQRLAEAARAAEDICRGYLLCRRQC
jgi:hypothetical protein